MARLKGLQSLWRMETIGGADAHDIHLRMSRQHLVDALIEAKIILHIQCGFGSDIAARNQRAARLSAHHFRMALSDVAQAYHREFEGRCRHVW
jgi:hypothetical protein